MNTASAGGPVIAPSTASGIPAHGNYVPPLNLYVKRQLMLVPEEPPHFGT